MHITVQYFVPVHSGLPSFHYFAQRKTQRQPCSQLSTALCCVGTRQHSQLGIHNLESLQNFKVTLLHDS
ncbi:hypothetical protein CDL15_Pgr005263 [Punica granatum]|uniref:Uncharacterized protein n=1 Tax=Punica granatum TaxID=22663 RepID=A0A218WK01_PUNGR|nr:hypothetical protein CDL15_Pgr005263 [Punica granatum]